MIFQQDIYLQ